MTLIQRLDFAGLKTLLKTLTIPRLVTGQRPRGRIRHITTEVLRESKLSPSAAAAAGLPFTSYPLPKAPPPAPAPPAPPVPAIASPPHKLELSQTGLQRRMDGSFYMRELPSSASLIPYDSVEGKKIFKQALDEGGLETFFPLSQQFLTQEEPACTFPMLRPSTRCV